MTVRRRVPSEIEAKLLASEERALRRVAATRRLGRYRLRPHDSVRLHSVYVDTPDLTLARHGVALRVRRDAGGWEVTAKWAGSVRGDVHERPELTVPLRAAPRMPFVLPTGPLQRRLAALVAGRPLAPILVSDIHRRRLDIFPADATQASTPVAELALDRVHLHGPAGPQVAVRYYEAEIELLHGRRRDVTNIARLLRQRFNLTPSGDSKFSRGLRLLYGRRRPRLSAPQRTRIRKGS